MRREGTMRVILPSFDFAFLAAALDSFLKVAGVLGRLSRCRWERRRLPAVPTSILKSNSSSHSEGIRVKTRVLKSESSRQSVETRVKIRVSKSQSSSQNVDMRLEVDVEASVK